MTNKITVIKAIIREYNYNNSFKNKLSKISYCNINKIYDLDNDAFYFFDNNNKKDMKYWNETTEKTIDYLFNLI